VDFKIHKLNAEELCGEFSVPLFSSHLFIFFFSHPLSSSLSVALSSGGRTNHVRIIYIKDTQLIWGV
jgi:hypothetical protein